MTEPADNPGPSYDALLHQPPDWQTDLPAEAPPAEEAAPPEIPPSPLRIVEAMLFIGAGDLGKGCPEAGRPTDAAGWPATL